MKAGDSGRSGLSLVPPAGTQHGRTLRLLRTVLLTRLCFIFILYFDPNARSKYSLDLVVCVFLSPCTFLVAVSRGGGVAAGRTHFLLSPLKFVPSLPFLDVSEVRNLMMRNLKFVCLGLFSCFLSINIYIIFWQKNIEAF